MHDLWQAEFPDVTRPAFWVMPLRRLEDLPALLEDYNENVRSKSIRLVPCTYLHNRDAIKDTFYELFWWTG